MARADRKGRTKGVARHVRHYEWFLACPAYRDLPCQARSLLIELYRLYNGENNGALFMSCRGAADLLNVSKNLPTKLFRELVEKGFIKVGRAASFNLKTKEATTWILTEFPVNGQLAGKDFMRWQPKAEIQNTVPLGGTDSTSRRDREPRTVPLGGTDSTSRRDRDLPNRPSHGPFWRDTDNIPG